jgi:hypothetical protein
MAKKFNHDFGGTKFAIPKATLFDCKWGIDLAMLMFGDD